jgi:DNA-binding PadR family transcriptional regulator
MSALSAGEAVLGLLVERPGPSNELERRLERRFGAARFAHGSAHQAVKRLAKQGLVRAVEGGAVERSVCAEDGGSPAYEATADGVAQFERWLLASSGTPLVREELQAKIAFCRPQDLPRMLELVREAELACVAQLQEFNERRRRERRRAGEDRWTELMGLVVATGDVVWWDARSKWLQALRRYLQQEAQRYAVGAASRR